MNLWQTIYRLRTEKNMSQGDLADALGVSRQSVSKWETGNATPDLERLVKMAKLFGVTLDELVGSGQEPQADAGSPEPKVIYVEKPVLPAISKHHIIGSVLVLCALIYGLVLSNGGYDPLEILILASPLAVCGILFLCTRNPLLYSGWVLAGTYWVYFLILFHRWENHPFLILLGVAAVIAMIPWTVRAHRSQQIHVPGWLWIMGGILLAALFLLLCMNCVPSFGVTSVEQPAIPVGE